MNNENDQILKLILIILYLHIDSFILLLIIINKLSLFSTSVIKWINVWILWNVWPIFMKSFHYWFSFFFQINLIWIQIIAAFPLMKIVLMKFWYLKSLVSVSVVNLLIVSHNKWRFASHLLLIFLMKI